MKIRGGKLLAKALHEKGITQVFTLSGGFCNPALEGMAECGMSVINSPHEQVAGHLADGFTRISRTPTVCLVGPEGFANAIPAMMEAWGERSPVIFLTGSSTLKRQGSGGFKEIDDVSIAKPLTKYSASITDGERIPEFVDRAFKIALSGYPGPVHLSLPVDIMFSSFDESVGQNERPFLRRPKPVPRSWPCPDDFKRILDLLQTAKKPVFIGGHGVWWSGAEKYLENAGRALRIPIFNIPYHQKLLSEESEVYMGLADFHQFSPSKFAFQQSDLVLMVGGRLDNQMNFGNPPFFPESMQVICINGSPEELEYNRAADQLLLSDPGAFFKELLKAHAEKEILFDISWLEENQRQRGLWVEQMQLDAEKKEEGSSNLHPLMLALEVQAAMGSDDWLVIDGGNTHFWSEIAINMAGWRGKKLKGILHPGTFSMLGVGVPFAIAAKLNQHKGHVVVISGDGAFLSGGLSIEASFQEKAPITVVIDNNGGLTTISQQQERLFGHNKHVATDFRDIPFHSMFEGLGGHGELVESYEQLQPALQRALSCGKTACVNVRTQDAISPIVLATTDKRDKASIE